MPIASAVCVIVIAVIRSAPASANARACNEWYSRASSRVMSDSGRYPSPLGPMHPLMTIGEASVAYFARTSSTSATASRLIRSRSAPEYPSFAPQAGLARHVGVSSTMPTPSRRAISA